MKSLFKKFILVFFSLIIFFSLFLGASVIYNSVGNKNNNANFENISLSVPAPQKDERGVLDRADMLERALKSVVGISSADAFSKNIMYMGSGVMATSDGYIITNQHVVGARPQRIEVTLHTGETLEGKTLWQSSALDLAIVKINGEGYTTSELADAKGVRVGEGVIAIGNPLSMQFERTVTAGIVSAVGRSISIENDDGTSSYMEDLIQTDASINPGNSGGPLLNESGEVIGINTIKVSTAEGMGFAVPVNICVPIIERLKSVGEFRTPYLGLYAYTRAAAKYYNENSSFEKGLYVARLDSYGPAFSAGIRSGDIILSVGGTEVNTMLALREELYKRQSGETVEIEFMREGTLRKVRVMLSTEE